MDVLSIQAKYGALGSVVLVDESIRGLDDIVTSKFDMISPKKGAEENFRVRKV